jgi:hypothetical protein
MPVPAIIPITGLILGTINFGNNIYNIAKAKPDEFGPIKTKLDEANTHLIGIETQLTNLEIAQGLSTSVDRILGFFKAYLTVVVPTVVSLKGGEQWSEDNALGKLDDKVKKSKPVKDWAQDVHDSATGASATLDAIHNAMMGSQVHGRGAIDAAFERALRTTYGVSTLQEVDKIPFERRKSQAPSLIRTMSNFMEYVLDFERTALGCLMNAALLQPQYQNPEIIRQQKRGLLNNADAQVQAARSPTRIGYFGFDLDPVASNILRQIKLDCNV